LRHNTERPETLDVGSNILAGGKPTEIVEKTKFMLDKQKEWKNPFGDGQASKRTIKILGKKID
jgi:UDP-N-acetylglucosamine 2-epimerase (non-hydrolysing)